MSKILKNTTGSDIDLNKTGIRVPASGQITVNEKDYIQLATSESIIELDSLLSSGDIVVNDGTLDLNYSEGLAFIKYPDQALNIRFDNSSNGFIANNVQEAIEEGKTFRFQYELFQAIGEMNYNQYLVAGPHTVTGLLSSSRRSGDASNGYRYSNSAPTAASFTGEVVSATAAIRGIAQSTGSPAVNMELKFELWKVGMTGSQGTKLGDVIFNIVSSSYTIGNFWNSSIVTQFQENQTQNINVTAGDLLGLKFISQTGNSKVVSVQNTTIILEILGQI